MPVQVEANGPQPHGSITQFLSVLPEPIGRLFYLAFSPSASPESMLWLYVAMRAALDALEHTSPLGAPARGDALPRARVIAEARAFWRESAVDCEQVLALAGLDAVRLRAYMAAEISRLERERGVIPMPAPIVPRGPRAGADMPDTQFSAIKAQPRPIVQRVRRRVSLADRAASAVVLSYLKRSPSHG